MAKAKSSILSEGSYAFSKQTKGKLTTSKSNLMLRRSKDGIVLGEKPIPTKKCTTKQKAQRDIWCECDTMYKAMTSGQRTIWIQYYNSMVSKGLTRTISLMKSPTGYNPYGPKDIGEKALFMQKCMTGNLQEFLVAYMQSTLRVLRVLHECESITVKVQAISQAEAQAPAEWREFKIERISF